MSWIKKLIISVFTCLLLGFTTTALADLWQYSIIMGVDSNGASLYLFRYDHDTNLPVIETLVIASTKTNLPSEFSNNQFDTTAQNTIEGLFNGAVAALKMARIDLATVPVKILIREGVQSLPEKDRQLVADTLKSRYKLNTVQFKTISIQEKSAYDWLSVNYLANNFDTGKEPVGTIDRKSVV